MHACICISLFSKTSLIMQLFIVELFVCIILNTPTSSLYHLPSHHTLPLPQVQAKVNLKYDSWHREILSRFGALLGENMQEFHTTIAKVTLSLVHLLKWGSTDHLLCCAISPSLQCRADLENHSVDAASTSEAVGFITLMQELKRKVRSWEQKVEVCLLHCKFFPKLEGIWSQ